MSRWYRYSVDVVQLQDVAGEPKDVRSLQSDRTVQVVPGGQSGITIQIQGTLDGVNWQDVGSPFASPAGGFLALTGAMRSVRVATTAWVDPVAVGDSVAVEVTRFVARVTLGPVNHLLLVGLADSVSVSDELEIEVNGVEQTVSSPANVLLLVEMADHERVSDDVSVELNADPPVTASDAAPRTIWVEMMDAVVVSDTMAIDPTREVVSSPVNHLAEVNLFDAVVLTSDDLELEIDAEDVTATASSTAPSTAIPSVFVAGFDDRAL